MESELRLFLIIVSFANSLLYFIIYAYFDTIMELIGSSLLSGGLQSFIKILVLTIAGFCLGLVPMLLLSPGMRRNRMDIRNLILVGIVPFILLILSPGQVTDFIANSIFSGNETIKELLFYLFSRQAIWSLWLGFAIGTSVRISFRKSRYSHAVKYTAPDRETIEEKNSEDN